MEKEMEKREKTGFQPCPLCGAELSSEDIRIIDDEGEVMEIAGEDGPSGTVYCRYTDSSGYIREADATDCIMLRCECGYCYCASGDAVGFPYEGWAESFRARADRRVHEVQYLEKAGWPLKNGTLDDVIARIAVGARPEWFRRASWRDGIVLSIMDEPHNPPHSKLAILRLKDKSIGYLPDDCRTARDWEEVRPELERRA